MQALSSRAIDAGKSAAIGAAGHEPSRALLARLLWSVSAVATLAMSETPLAAPAPNAAPVPVQGGQAAAASDTSDEERRARAESLFERGLAFQRQGQTAPACKAFEQSAAVMPTPHAFLQVGNCREPGDPAGALASFEAALAAAEGVAHPARRAAYERAALSRIEPLRQRVPTLTLWPSPTPGSRVEIMPGTSGSAHQVTSFGSPARFNSGRYRLRAAAPGHRELTLDIDLAPAQHLVIRLPALAELSERDEHSADSSLTPVPAPASSAPLAAESDGSSGGIGIVPIALAGTGATLLVASFVTGRISSAARGDLEDDCAPPDPATGLRACSPSLAATKQQARDYAVATDVLWVGGAALAGAGIAWFLLDDGGGDSPRVGGGCSFDGCGVALSGSF